MHSRDSSAWGKRRSRKNPPSRLFFFSCFPRFFIPPGLFPDGEGWDEMIEEAWWLAAHDWVMGCLSFSPLLLFLLLSPCSFLISLPLFVGVSFFVLFYVHCFLLLSCFSVSLPSSFTPCPERWSTIQRDGMKRKEKKAVARTITCYNISQSSSLFLIFSLSLFSPLSVVFCIFRAGKTIAFSFSFDSAPAHLYVPPPTTISHAPNDEPTPFSPPPFLYTSSCLALCFDTTTVESLGRQTRSCLRFKYNPERRARYRLNVILVMLLHGWRCRSVGQLVRHFQSILNWCMDCHDILHIYSWSPDDKGYWQFSTFSATDTLSPTGYKKNPQRHRDEQWHTCTWERFCSGHLEKITWKRFVQISLSS